MLRAVGATERAVFLCFILIYQLFVAGATRRKLLKLVHWRAGVHLKYLERETDPSM